MFKIIFFGDLNASLYLDSNLLTKDMLLILHMNFEIGQRRKCKSKMQIPIYNNRFIYMVEPKIIFCIFYHLKKELKFIDALLSWKLCHNYFHIMTF